jgi:hypothetical protein
MWTDEALKPIWTQRCSRGHFDDSQSQDPAIIPVNKHLSA